MNFLNGLRCKTDPFTPPSGKEIFLSQAVQDALKKLSHNILIGAGLQIVIGAEGLGKTTLLKQLSQKFSAENNTVVLLLNNPQFRNLQQFLIAVAGIFKTIKIPSGFDDNLLQKAFNSFFFKLCLQEKKTVVLLIDNGQDLPDFCLNALNSFYNFHPDCRNLLQTVIGCEPSLLKKIYANKSLNSQVVFAAALKPLGFKDTRKFILFHLERSAVDPSFPPVLFSLPAQGAIYYMTQGHPKEIIDLYHFIVLTLDIESRKKVDWFLTLRCAKLLLPHRAKKLQILQASSLSGLAVLVLVLGLWSEQIKTLIVPQLGPLHEVTAPQQVPPPEPQPPGPGKVPPKTAPATILKETQVAGVAPAENSAALPEQPKNKAPSVQSPGLEPATGAVSEPQLADSSEPGNTRVEPPEYLGDIIAASGETFGDMVRVIYGPWSFNPENVQTVMAVNPDLKNPELLNVGHKVRFPAIPVALTPKAEEVWWIRINTLDNIQSAYRFLRKYRKTSPPLLIIPSRDDRGRVLMNILLEEYFVDKESAQKAIQALSAEISAQSQALHGLSPAVFYYRLKEKD